MADKFKSYGKINLSLDVVGTRDDGYHLISSVMAEIELCDVITMSVEKSDKFENEIVLSCNKPYIPCNEKNSAYKAAQIMLRCPADFEGGAVTVPERIEGEITACIS